MYTRTHSYGEDVDGNRGSTYVECIIEDSDAEEIARQIIVAENESGCELQSVLVNLLDCINEEPFDIEVCTSKYRDLIDSIRSGNDK